MRAIWRRTVRRIRVTNGAAFAITGGKRRLAADAAASDIPSQKPAATARTGLEFPVYSADNRRTVSKVKLPTVLPDWAAAGNALLNPEAMLARLEGQKRFQAGDFAVAERFFEIAVQRADQFRYSRGMRAQMRLHLAESLRRQEKLTDAEAIARDGIALAALAHRHSLYAELLDCLGEIFLAQENYAAAEAVTEEALRAEQSRTRRDQFRIARRQQRLGLARYRIGRCVDAIPALESSIQTLDAAYGPDHEETGKVLSELGHFYHMEGRYKDAQRHLRRALQIYDRKRGPASKEASQVVQILASSYEADGDLRNAGELYERTLIVKERALGGNLEELAEMQFDIAGRFVDWGDYTRARELLSEAIGTFKRRKDARLALAHEAMAHVEENCSRYAEALAELTHAGKLWETLERNAELRWNLEHRAEVLDLLRNRTEARFLRERVAGMMA
jgi:tetratricopeptide (TPR) repeat protein